MKGEWKVICNPMAGYIVARVKNRIARYIAEIINNTLNERG